SEADRGKAKSAGLERRRPDLFQRRRPADGAAEPRPPQLQDASEAGRAAEHPLARPAPHGGHAAASPKRISESYAKEARARNHRDHHEHLLPRDAGPTARRRGKAETTASGQASVET